MTHSKPGYSTLANEGYWDQIITPQKSLLNLNLKEIWQYRDLLMLFVRRDLVAQYKQTILGPLWYFIQPLLTTLIFVLIFARVAGISTEGLPPTLFYLSAIINWNYFADCLNKTAVTFKDNQQIFGKVYFPRLTVPMSIVLSNLAKYLIQLLLFFGVYLYHIFAFPGLILPTWALIGLPIYILIVGSLGLGLGLIITALTTKYRDLVFLVQFGVQLLMYATPVIYSLSAIPEKYRWLSLLNPLTGVIEAFRYGCLGKGTFSPSLILYSFFATSFILFLGVIIFNRTERSFIDTV